MKNLVEMESRGGPTGVPIWWQILEPTHRKPQKRLQENPGGSLKDP